MRQMYKASWRLGQQHLFIQNFKPLYNKQLSINSTQDYMLRNYSSKDEQPSTNASNQKKKSIGQLIKNNTNLDDELKRIEAKKEEEAHKQWEEKQKKKYDRYKHWQRISIACVTFTVSVILLKEYRKYLKNPRGHLYDRIMLKIYGGPYRDYISVEFPYKIVDGCIRVFTEGLEHMATKEDQSYEEKKLYHDFYNVSWPWFRFILPSYKSIQRPGMILRAGGDTASGGIMIEDGLSNLTHLAYLKADEDKVRQFGADTYEKRQFQMILEDYLSAGFTIESNHTLPSNLEHNTIDIAILVRDNFMKNEVGHFSVEGHPKLLPSNEEWMAIASMYGPDGYIYIGARTYPTAGINAALLKDAGGPEPPQHWPFPSTFEHDHIESYLTNAVTKLMKDDLRFDNKITKKRVSQYSKEEAFQLVHDLKKE